MPNMCVSIVVLNKPPSVKIHFSRSVTYDALHAKKAHNTRLFTTILENSIDLSRLLVTAFESNKKINKDINIIERL